MHLIGYNSVADNTGLSSFVQLLLPPKHEKCSAGKKPNDGRDGVCIIHSLHVKSSLMIDDATFIHNKKIQMNVLIAYKKSKGKDKHNH